MYLKSGYHKPGREPRVGTLFGSLDFCGLRLGVMAALGICLLSPAALFAVRTESLTHETFRDFLDGEFENVSLSSYGELILAPRADRLVGPDEPIIWNAASDRNGGFFFGTGNKGKVYHLSEDGALEEIFKPEQVLSRSLAVDEEGTLYVGTSPEGKLYRIPEGGEVEVFFEPEEHYIWDVVFDGEGNIFVATGARGRIYRLEADHEPGDAVEVFFDSEETHISTLTWDGEDRLLAGTSPGGLVFRFDDEGKPFAILNTEDQEIKRIVTAEDGTLYVATFTGDGSGRAAPSRPTGNIANVISAIIGTGDSDENNEGRSQAQRGDDGKISMIYRVDPDGFSEPHWVLPRYAIHSMLRMPDGSLLVGTGTEGRIFSVSGPEDWKLLQKLENGGEVSVLLPGSENEGEVYALTSNPAHIYRMDFSRASEGHFTSRVYDAEQTARWGRLHLDGAGQGVRVATRSGNTDKPEKTWSEWTEPVAPSGHLAVESPAARYIQYRIYLESGDEAGNPLPRVDRTRLFFRKFNAAPVIAGVKLVPHEVALERVPAAPQPPGIDLDQLFAEGREGRSGNRQNRSGQMRVQEKPGLATLAWKATDPNDDTLSFTLKIRSEGETRWSTLAEDLRENFFSFNTSGFEEGRYYAKVIASDHLSNPPGKARTASRQSDAFLIDNTGPAVDVLEKLAGGNNVVLRVEVEDPVSIIKDARYYLNGGERTPLFPEDGFFDSRRETFKIELNDLDPGSYSMIVVAEDEAGNERVRKIHFTVD